MKITYWARYRLGLIGRLRAMGWRERVAHGGWRLWWRMPDLRRFMR
jgi:hypothetical protein